MYIAKGQAIDEGMNNFTTKFLTAAVKKILILCTVFLLSYRFSHAQLSVTPAHPVNNSLEKIVQSLVGQGVRVSNITSNQPTASLMYGTFSEPSSQLGIKQGLLMTTGIVQNARGPNNSDEKTAALGHNGDRDLTTMIGGPDSTYDACVIEFDIITTSSQISFNYIFASEEYPEYVGSFYNDIFAFLISGPGITGKRNLALIPSTSTPVSINNVNDLYNTAYYRDNGDGVNYGGPIIQYDGYTVKLQAVAQVMPCQTYHLKLAIADVADDAYDSGVFIESGSLSGSEGIMINNLLAPDSLFLCPSQFPVTLEAGITPVPDYSWLKNNVEVATGSKYYNVTDEGWYKVRAYLQPSCYWTDSIRIIVSKDFDLIPSPDTGVCIGGSSTTLNVRPNGPGQYTYQWTPSAYLNNPTIQNPIATVSAPTTFKVVVANTCFRDSAQINISVYPKPVSDAHGDTTICRAGTAYLSADYSNQYLYSWSPAASLSNASIYNPVAHPESSTQYVLTVNNRGCTKQDSVQVTVLEEVKAKILLFVNYGQVPWKVKLRNISTGASNYTWYCNGFSNTNIDEPTYEITEEGYYTVLLRAENNLGCFDYDTLYLKAYKLYIPNLITPNNDGKNDSFEITGLGDQFHVEIYNRWGDRVYKKSQYKNEWNGDGLSDGIYYFTIYDSFLDKTYKGWVQLLR